MMYKILLVFLLILSASLNAFDVESVNNELTSIFESSVYNISGYIYDDKNHNGLKDSEEKGLTKNSYIKLCQNGNFIRSIEVKKNSDGYYLFQNIKSGSYTLIEDASDSKDCAVQKDPEGWISTTSNIVNISLTKDIQNQNFGDFYGSKISGKVFDDLNQNGHLDSDEKGIANVKLTIKRCGNIQFDSTVTDSNGNYTFWIPVGVQGDNSVDGWIAVFETDPIGYTSTGDEFNNGNGNQNESGEAQKDDNWLCFSNRGVDFDDGGYVLTGNNFGDTKGLAFTCSQDAYLFNGHTTTDIYGINLSTGRYALKKNKIDAFINATGYNVKDNFIWGYDIKSHKIIKIDANFHMTYFKLDKLPDDSYYAGDVSKDGILYLKSNKNNKLYKINLNNDIPKYDGYVSLKISKILKFGDYAFNPVDSFLYGINYQDGHLYKIDVSSGEVKDLGKENIDINEAKHFHTYVFDKNGFLYFYGTSGKIYKIDLSKNTSSYQPSLFTTTNLKKSGGDGAKCPNSVIAKPKTCEEVFPGVLNSTDDYITITGAATINNNNNPLITKKLLATSAICDGGICKKSNTLAAAYDVNVKRGSGKDGSNFYGTINSSKEFENAILEGNVNINGNIEIKIKNSFISTGYAQLNINGNVTIYANSITIGGMTSINIQSGSLKLIANDITVSGSSIGSESKSIVLLSKKNITFDGFGSFKTLAYADNEIKVSGAVSIEGSLTAKKIKIAAGSILKYNGDYVKNFCNPDSSLPNITIDNVQKYEGDSGKTLYKVTINLDKPAPSDLTLVYSTEDGTAKQSDHDYQSVSGEKVIPKGTESFSIDVYAYGDKKVENDEYFYLNIKLIN